jgi:hypothetical protein
MFMVVLTIENSLRPFFLIGQEHPQLNNFFSFPHLIYLHTRGKKYAGLDNQCPFIISFTILLPHRPSNDTEPRHPLSTLGSERKPSVYKHLQAHRPVRGF